MTFLLEFGADFIATFRINETESVKFTEQFTKVGDGHVIARVGFLVYESDVNFKKK
jgi:hypothetical protein